MDKSRRQFEEWFKKEYPLIESQPKNTLLQSVKRQCQKAWQASRERLEVELPEPFIANENCETWCYDEDLVNQVLISNGVKIKDE